MKLTFQTPEGAYYVMTDIAELQSGMDNVEFVRWMIRDVGVAAVPGSSFYAPRERGRIKVRFMFAKREEMLHAAGQRLLQLRDRLSSR